MPRRHAFAGQGPISRKGLGHSSTGFVLVVLLIASTFAGYALTHLPTSSSPQLSAQGQCTSPVPPSPASSQTAFKNGTVVWESWLEVLIMPEGSAGQVCVQYSSSAFGGYNGQAYSDAYRINGSEAESFPTSLVNVTAVPSQVLVSTYVNDTITYGLVSAEGSRGFYALGMLQFCPSVPLVVGYQKAELNMSDFAWALGVNYGCPPFALGRQVVGLTNVQAVYLPVLNRYTMTYNITGSSVHSFNPTPTVQNVTFKLQIQTFASPLNVSLDLNDSTLDRYAADPALTRLPANDSCSWYPNNDQAVVGSESTALDQFGPTNMTINAPSIQIPPYANATYTLSIRLANLSRAYYYTLDPTVSFVVSGGQGAELQSVAAYYPINIGRSDFTGSLAQALSGSCS